MNMLELLNPADDHVPEIKQNTVEYLVPVSSDPVVEAHRDDTTAACSLMMLGTNDDVHTPQIVSSTPHTTGVRSPVLLPVPSPTTGFQLSPLATKTVMPASAWPTPMPVYEMKNDAVAVSPPPMPLRRRLSSISSMLNELEIPRDAPPTSPSPPTSTTTPQDFCTVTGCLRRPSQQNQGKCAVHKGMKLCQIEGCFRPVQSRGCCKSHGGGARCKYPDCAKGAISKGRCRTHGGGTRCAVPDCLKWAQRFGCCVRHSKSVTPKPQLL